MGEDLREEERKENGAGHSPEGECTLWVLPLEVFLSLLHMGVLGEVSGESFSRLFISFPGVPFQGHGLH